MKQHTLITIGLFLLFLLGCQAYELTYRYQEVFTRNIRSCI
ncbi:MAG: hypothetical protein ACI3ZY_09910 [Parabacteroides sp.]